MRALKHLWNKEETIAVLRLFLKNGNKNLSKNNVKVLELAELFQRKAIAEKRETYPSAASIAMKLGNFTSLLNQKGLSHVSKLDKQVWQEYAIPYYAQEIVEAEEGTRVTVTHLLYERNIYIVNKKKRQAALKGALECEICHFNFEKVYGKVGKNFIEVHHIVPLAEAKGLHKTKLEDLILVCSNCHRMLHRLPSKKAVDMLKNSLMSMQS